MKAILSPSLLSADLADTAREVENLEKAGISWLHLDVMDGLFVPNITFGAPLIKALRSRCSLFFDVHLMIERPELYVADFAAAGADLLVVHLEALTHAQRVLELIAAHGMKAGVALNPATDPYACRWILPNLDLILIMGVNPGFSGQKYIPQTREKVFACRDFLDKYGYGNIAIEVDGGVNLQNAGELVNSGADALVSGSAFFGTGNYAEAAKAFAAAMESDNHGASSGRVTAWRHAKK